MHVQDDIHPPILRMFEATFPLDVAIVIRAFAFRKQNHWIGTIECFSRK